MNTLSPNNTLFDAFHEIVAASALFLLLIIGAITFFWVNLPRSKAIGWAWTASFSYRFVLIDASTLIDILIKERIYKLKEFLLLLIMLKMFALFGQPVYELTMTFINSLDFFTFSPIFYWKRNILRDLLGWCILRWGLWTDNSKRFSWIDWPAFHVINLLHFLCLMCFFLSSLLILD